MKIFVYVIIGIVAVSVIAGFFIVGSPKEARLTRADDQRVQHLTEIQWQIVNYWQRKEALPPALEALNDDISGFRVPVDPETDELYEYNIEGPLAFTLCATFNRPSAQDISRPIAKPAVPLGREPFAEIQDTWSHGADKTYFERTIDPELYPPLGKTRG